jgi:hypothetical protein
MTSKISYPHDKLTKINGIPDAASIQLLIKQVYANTRSVPSVFGGAANGYLGIAMPAADYLLRAQVAFNPPAPVGNQPVHAQGAAAAVIGAANRLWDEDKANYREYSKVKSDITQQIIEAVNPVYFATLDDPTFGFADVTIPQFIAHLQTTYGTLDAATLETNRDRLKEQWNPDEPFENSWLHIKTIRAVATSGNHPIDEFHTMSLAQTALRQAGVYDHDISRWYDRPEADKTWANFVLHFNHHEKKRKESLTAQTAGYHGANHANSLAPPNAPPGTHIAAAIAPDSTPPNAFQLPGVFYYCWTHGISNQANHTSATCLSKREGHVDDATAHDRKGGTQKYNFGRANNSSSRTRRLPVDT